MSDTKAILVVGAGDGTGGAVARRFAREGFVACLARRGVDKLAPLVAAIEGEGGRAHAFGADSRDENEVIALFDRVEREIAPVEVAVFNVGGMARAPIRDLSREAFVNAWELGCLGGFLVGREAARRMVPRGRGTILFTGASASLRGRANFSAFAVGKFGLRALVQSMARELGPEGIHVAHVVIDGGINTPRLRAQAPERAALAEKAGLLEPDAIAEAYWALHCQPRNAWTHEIDLRPWVEQW